jgi:hypothetical protein
MGRISPNSKKWGIPKGRVNARAIVFVADSSLEEAVSSEPVSEVSKFPASRDFTGNFIDSRLRGA